MAWLAASRKMMHRERIRNKNLMVASQRMLPTAQALNIKGTGLTCFTGINKNLYFAPNLSFKFSSPAVSGIRLKSKITEFWNVLDL